MDSGLPMAFLDCGHRKKVRQKSIGLIETAALALEEVNNKIEHYTAMKIVVKGLCQSIC